MTVTPDAPTRDGNDVTVPSMEGVTYNPEPGVHEIPVDGSLTVTATAESGYTLEGTTEWVFDYEEPPGG